MKKILSFLLAVLWVAAMLPVEVNAENLCVNTEARETEEISVESDGVSFYTVEFTYGELQYVLGGGEREELSTILDAVGIKENDEITDVEGSNDELFKPVLEDNVWYIEALKAFSSEEWLKVTIDGIEYEIVVTDDQTVTTLEGLIEALKDTSIDTVIVGNTITLTDGTHLNGNGKTVQVEKPFITEDGKRNNQAQGKKFIPENTSLYKVFDVPANANVTIENMTIVGGFGAGSLDEWSEEFCNTAGGVSIAEGAKVTMTNVSVTRSYRGIYNKGTLILKDSNIVRNSGLYGAGVQNETDALVIMDGCSFSENSAERIDYSVGNFDTYCAGGGSENKGTMILNNTTMANNFATKMGGGIHNWEGGKMYIMNSTIAGNYAMTDSGGGIYANRGSITIINSLVAYNIASDNVSSYSDVARNTSEGTSINMINCVYGNVGDSLTMSNCIKVSDDDLDNLFANYRNDGIYTSTGFSNSFKHPSLINKDGNVSATYAAPKTDSKAVWSSGSEVKTYLDYSNTSAIKMSYKVGSGSETPVGSYATGGSEVTSYYETSGRDGSVCGASKPIGDIYYTVLLKSVPTNGSVTGVTTYGDAHKAGSNVTVKAIPNEGYAFIQWNDGSGNSLSKDAEYTFTVESDVTLQAEFTDSPAVASVTQGGETTYYPSLQSAIDATTTGEIVLLGNTTENITIVSGKNITLDINGKKLNTTSISGNVNISDSASSTAVHYFKYHKLGAWTLYDEANDGEKTAAITLAELNNIEEPNDATIVKLMGGIISGGTTLNLKEGTVTMSGGTIVGNKNSSNFGGGVVVSGGEFIMDDGAAIIGNISYSGGAMHIANSAKFTMNGGVIAYNSASNDTAGISVGNGNTMIMTGGSIEHNYSAGNIGAIFARGSTTIIIEGNAKITNNRADGNSAAIHAGGASLTIKGNAEISNNIANDFGGAVNACGGNTVIEGNAKIINNTAGTYGGGISYSGGNLKIGGAAQITGNLVGSGSEKINQNVYLAGNPTITFSQPESGMNIGITMANEGVFTSDSADGYLDYIHSDDSNCKIIYDTNKKLKLVKKYNVTIDNTITNGTVTTSATDGKVFEADTVTVMVTPNTGYSLKSLKYNDGSDHDITSAKCFSMPGADVSVTAEFEHISGASEVTTVPTANTLTYSGSEQQLVEAGVAQNGTMNYVLGTDATAEPDSGWSSEIPVSKNAGTYYVWYKSVGDSYYSDTDPLCVTVTITKSTPAAPTGLEGVKTTTVGGADGKITGTTAEMEYSATTDFASATACEDTEIQNLSAGTYYVRYKETANTNASAYATVVVSDKDKENFNITVSNYNASFDGKAHGITLTGVPEGAEVKYGVEENVYDKDSVSFTDYTDGAKNVFVKVTKEGYVDYYGSGTVTVSKKDIANATVGDFETLEYTGEAQTPSATVTIDGLTVTGAWSDVTEPEDKTSFTANGNFTGTLKDYETGMTAPAPDGELLVPPEKEKENFSGGGMANTAEELKSMVVSADDRAEMQSGKDISVWLEVKEMSSLTAEETAVVENTMPTEFGQLLNLDISLWKQVEGQEANKVTEVSNGAITVKFTVPAELRKDNREFKVLKIHGEKAEILDAVYSAEDGHIVFRTSEFSTYILIYRDKENKPVEVYYAPLVADLRANENGTITWKAGDGLPLEAVRLLVEKPELSLEFTFTYEGEEHTIFIPAGTFEQYYDVNIPWYGPAWLIGHFEKTEKSVVEYTIVKDDTLNDLSVKFGCTVEEILALNPYIKDAHWIYPNNKLLIPVQK